MAFCTSCGASVSGAFCQQCGQPAGSGACWWSDRPFPPPRPPDSRRPPRHAQDQPHRLGARASYSGSSSSPEGRLRRSSSVARTVQRAGLDPDDETQPRARRRHKLIATLNPDLEVLNVSEAKGVITVKEKSSGKVVTLNFDDIKQGRIVINEGGRREDCFN